jgi:predicted ATPase
MADRRIESCHKQAEALFEQSINLSRRQGALTLELASAVGLSRYWASRGRAQEAHSLLKGVVDQITEGHDLPPMIEARALIESLEGSVELS